MMLKNSNSRRSASGFTLIELLTVIAIIGILAAILIPVVGSVRESAKRAKCGSNVRMLVQACHLYAEEAGYFTPTEDYLPPPINARSNWILILSEGGYTDKVVSIAGGGDDQLWFCPTAVRYRDPAGSNANSYGRNDQTGPWRTNQGVPYERRPADSPDRAAEPTRTAMVMDGHWNGSRFETFTNTELLPDFVHPPSSANDSGAGINVGFIDGHVEFRTKGDGTGTNDVPTVQSDIFWSGVPQ